jgi:hypothetical protein
VLHLGGPQGNWVKNVIRLEVIVQPPVPAMPHALILFTRVNNWTPGVFKSEKELRNYFNEYIADPLEENGEREEPVRVEAFLLDTALSLALHTSISSLALSVILESGTRRTRSAGGRGCVVLL